jgi:hypothetical protein
MVKNTRLLLLPESDPLPAEIAQLFISSFKEVITISSPAEIDNYLQVNGSLTRILRFDLRSDLTRQLLSLLARKSRAPH